MRLLTFSILRKWHNLNIFHNLNRRLCNKVVNQEQDVLTPDSLDETTDFLEFESSWPPTMEPVLRESLKETMRVIPNFVSEEEEKALMAELEPILRKMRYEFDHWDDAIHGFRETERATWSADSAAAMSRLTDAARMRSAGPLLAHAHVLDLAAGGHIKPHVDAVRFCGNVIAGICLLSSAVMRLQHARDSHLAVNALLPRRAVYIMSDTARYDFSHAILKQEESRWRGQRVVRGRRVAVILRTQPGDKSEPPT